MKTQTLVAPERPKDEREERLREAASDLYGILGMCVGMIRRHLDDPPIAPVSRENWLLALSQWDKVSTKIEGR